MMEQISIKSSKDLTLAENLVTRYTEELAYYKRRKIAGISVSERNKTISNFEDTIKVLNEKIADFKSKTPAKPVTPATPAAKPVKEKKIEPKNK